MNFNICEQTHKREKKILEDVFSKNPDEVDSQREYDIFKDKVITILGDEKKLNAFHLASMQVKHHYSMKKLFCKDKLEKINHEYKRDILKMYVELCREAQSFNVVKEEIRERKRVSLDAVEVGDTVICVNVIHPCRKHLTKGKEYQVTRVHPRKKAYAAYFEILDDNNSKRRYKLNNMNFELYKQQP